jgi:hypothetical protein
VNPDFFLSLASEQMSKWTNKETQKLNFQDRRQERQTSSRKIKS